MNFVVTRKYKENEKSFTCEISFALSVRVFFPFSLRAACTFYASNAKSALERTEEVESDTEGRFNQMNEGFGAGHEMGFGYCYSFCIIIIIVIPRVFFLNTFYHGIAKISGQDYSGIRNRSSYCRFAFFLSHVSR